MEHRIHVIFFLPKNATCDPIKKSKVPLRVKVGAKGNFGSQLIISALDTPRFHDATHISWLLTTIDGDHISIDM
jgi:hypothetical protein